MKLLDCFIEIPLTGICKIDISKINKKTFGFSSIIRNHDKYRLYNRRAGVKNEISKNDAMAIVEKFNLIYIADGIFANAGSYMTSERIENFYKRLDKKAKK